MGADDVVALWFAITLVGATASGAYGLIAGRPAPPPEVVIRFEGRGQGLVAGDAVALRPYRVARGQELSDAVEEALAVTKERAKRLVADWEERIGRAFSELTRLAT